MTAMMPLEVALFDYWHAGSGRGRGPVVDAEVVRTPAGLPVLPGRTLRGICREGVAQAVEAQLVEHGARILRAAFGDRTWGPGCLAFEDATLGPAYEEWARQLDDRTVIESLYVQLASTRIEPGTGVADDRTLRTIEAVVPVCLSSRVFLRDELLPTASDDGGPVTATQVWSALTAGIAFVRGLGSGRRRGLGRVRITRADHTAGEHGRASA